MTIPENPLNALVRPEISHFEPYIPGRSMETVRRERKLKRIYKLASNENALGPSPRALKAMASIGKDLFRYPDGVSYRLREAVAKYAGAAIDRVIIGAGSDELIELLGKTFLNPGDSIVVSEHAFVRYRMAADLMGAATLSVPMTELRHDLQAMGAAIREDTKILFIANPNNPTGTYNSASELERLLGDVESLVRRRGKPLLVVVDEAYYEYARDLARDYPDTLALQKRFSNLAVLRTFSKAHALAGLRIGYGFADPSVIAAIDRVRPPFNVSTAAQAAGIASLLDKGHIRRSVALVRQERRKVLPILERLGLVVVPSIGNFYLLDVSPRRGADLFEALLNRGIIVRSMEEYGFPNHIRVTYGLPAENKLFLKCLQEALAV